MLISNKAFKIVLDLILPLPGVLVSICADYAFLENHVYVIITHFRRDDYQVLSIWDSYNAAMDDLKHVSQSNIAGDYCYINKITLNSSDELIYYEGDCVARWEKV